MARRPPKELLLDGARPERRTAALGIVLHAADADDDEDHKRRCIDECTLHINLPELT